MSLILFALSLAAQAGPPEPLQQTVTGKWVIDEELSVIEPKMAAAVEAAVAQMSFYIRPFARPRLQEGANWCREYHMSLSHAVYDLKCDAKKPVVRKLDNTDGPITNDQGEPVEVEVKTTADTVTIIYRGPSGTRRNDFKFMGDRMIVNSSVSSDMLPEPMAWTLAYRKAK